jgi:hypothetical protein
MYNEYLYDKDRIKSNKDIPLQDNGQIVKLDNQAVGSSDKTTKFTTVNTLGKNY